MSISAEAEPLVPIRSWQFHVLDVPYVISALDRAKDYDVNTVVYSHEMIGRVSDLYDGTGRAGKLLQLADEAHDRGLKVWIWVRELERDIPDRYLEGEIAHIDRQGFWDYLTDKYVRLFDEFPGFDGLMLTCHETDHKIFRNSDVASELSMPGRFAKLINTIHAVCQPRRKTFVVRSFLYEPEEQAWFREGLSQVSTGVMLQSKCVPHDWQPFYPHNPMIGAFPDRKLIVEFDCSSEFTGRNAVPYTSPSYFAHRWRYDLSQPGVVGYNARLDHAGYDALSTPNEINIYTLSRLTSDAKVEPDRIWHEWTIARYGKEAAPFVEAALRPSFDVINKSFFNLEFWITNHSMLPSFQYADRHITIRTNAKWKPDRPELKKREVRLRHPDPEILEMIIAEKDEAVALADRALHHLSQARPHLKGEDYDDLFFRLHRLRRTAEVWRLHAEAFFGYKVLAEAHRVEGLRERVIRALDGLDRQAEVSKQIGIVESRDPPAAAETIRAVAAELREMVEALGEQ